MAAHGRDDDMPFLSRWSQRKRQAEEAAPEAEAAAVKEVEPTAEPEEEVDLAQLPDIDTLDAGSDFTMFMRKGVPNTLKQRALSRLWQVDPVFKHICMLDDYNLDYTDAAMVVPNLKTLYQVGRGMVLPGEDDDEPPVADATAEALPEAEAEATALPQGDGEGGASAESASADAAKDTAEDAGTPTALTSANAAADPRAEEEDRPEGPPAAGDAGPRPTKPAAPECSGARAARRRRWGDVEA